VQVFLINKTVSVLVNHIEGLFELLDLSLVEHSKNIGRRSLGPLFGGHSAAGSFTGRHFAWGKRKSQSIGSENPTPNKVIFIWGTSYRDSWRTKVTEFWNFRKTSTHKPRRKLNFIKTSGKSEI